MQNVGVVNDHLHGCFRATDYTQPQLTPDGLPDRSPTSPERTGVAAATATSTSTRLKPSATSRPAAAPWPPPTDCWFDSSAARHTPPPATRAGEATRRGGGRPAGRTWGCRGHGGGGGGGRRPAAERTPSIDAEAIVRRGLCRRFLSRRSARPPSAPADHSCAARGIAGLRPSGRSPVRKCDRRRRAVRKAIRLSLGESSNAYAPRLGDRGAGGGAYVEVAHERQSGFTVRPFSGVSLRLILRTVGCHTEPTVSPETALRSGGVRACCRWRRLADVGSVGPGFLGGSQSIC